MASIFSGSWLKFFRADSGTCCIPLFVLVVILWGWLLVLHHAFRLILGTSCKRGSKYHNLVFSGNLPERNHTRDWSLACHIKRMTKKLPFVQFPPISSSCSCLYISGSETIFQSRLFNCPQPHNLLPTGRRNISPIRQRSNIEHTHFLQYIWNHGEMEFFSWMQT